MLRVSHQHLHAAPDLGSEDSTISFLENKLCILTMTRKVVVIEKKTEQNLCPCADTHRVTCCVTANPMTGSPSKISHVTTAELTSISLMVTLSGADSVASVSRRGNKSLKTANEYYTLLHIREISSTLLPLLVRLAPLIPALMNQTRLSLRSSRAGETPSASASEFLTRPASLPFLLSPPHISLKCDS